MTKRQEAYRKYLKTAHWEDLRTRAIKRDGSRCRRCNSSTRLQVHHLCYRGRYEDTVLEDLETICRECHRKEHGLGPNEYESYYRVLELNWGLGHIATDDELRTLSVLAVDYDERLHAEGFIRMMAYSRIKGSRWDSWLRKPTEVKLRLFWWSRKKFDRLTTPP